MYRSCQSVLLAALLLFTSNCTFHKFLNVWGLGWNPVPFDVSLLCSSFSLSLSHFLLFGSRGRRGRRGTNDLVKGKRKWSWLLQKVMVKLNTKPRKKYIAMPNYSAVIGAELLEQWRGMGVTVGRIWSTYLSDRYMPSWLEHHTLKSSGQILYLN